MCFEDFCFHIFVIVKCCIYIYISTNETLSVYAYSWLKYIFYYFHTPSHTYRTTMVARAHQNVPREWRSCIKSSTLREFTQIMRREVIVSWWHSLRNRQLLHRCLRACLWSLPTEYTREMLRLIRITHRIIYYGRLL